MSKRAEEAALKAYPEKDALNKKATGHYDPNYQRRKAYQQGYEQAEKDWEQIEAEHGKELLYVCQKTAEREHRRGVREGRAQAEKELIPLINRLCEAILFEWKDAADLARKIQAQIKAREE